MTTRDLEAENVRLLLALREAGGSLSEYATGYSHAAIKHAQKVIAAALSPPSASEQIDARGVAALAALTTYRRALAAINSPPRASEQSEDDAKGVAS